MAQAQPSLNEHPSAATKERSDAGAKVTVACKLPGGIVLRAYVESSESEAVLGGGTREAKVFRWNGEEATVFGVSVPFGQVPKCLIVGGYALTPNVPKDLWDNWLAANRNSDMVKHRLIFAHERADYAQDKAKEHEATRSGFEPIDPANPGKKIRGIEKADIK